MKRMLLSMFLIVFVALSGTAYAQMQKGGAQYKDRIFKELDLTSEQQAKLTENRQAQYEKTKELFKAIKEREEKLREVFNDPKATRITVESVVKEIKSLQAELIDNRVNGILAVRTILTPEQFAKFNQMIKKRKGEMKEHRNRWQERRGQMGDEGSGPTDEELPPPPGQ